MMQILKKQNIWAKLQIYLSEQKEIFTALLIRNNE